MATTSQDPFLDAIIQTAAAALAVSPDLVRPLVKAGADPAKGDYAVPCFPLAKAAGKNPAELAGAAAAQVAAGSAGGLIARAEAAGPYLNLFLDPAVAAERVVAQVLAEGKAYGSSLAAAGRVFVIDYSSPNIAKHLAFHHIRSTMIGNALARILRFQGATVYGCNFLGDWGMSFAKLIVAMDRYGVGATDLEGDTLTKLQDLYVRFNADAKNDPALDEQARETFAKLEGGDAEMESKWSFIRQRSLQVFLKLYERLGVSFDDFTGEAAYDQAKQNAVVERLQRAGLTEVDDEGRLVVDLSSARIKVPCILKKSDGSSLYATRDLAAVFDRQQRFHFDEALYVVDMGQSLHFKQWFQVVHLLGEPWADGLAHLPFGVVVNAEGGRLRTREGGAVLLGDVLDEAVARIRQLIDASIADGRTELADAEEIAQVAEALGVGAVVFNDLKTARVKDVKFDMAEIVAIDGYTAPYIQYAHARINGIFRKAGLSTPPASANLRVLVHPREQALVRELRRFGDVVARAAAEREPSVLAAYLYEVATELSRFYHDCRVVSDDIPLRDARLSIIAAVRQVLANGLNLLGIRAPERI